MHFIIILYLFLGFFTIITPIHSRLWSLPTLTEFNVVTSNIRVEWIFLLVLISKFLNVHLYCCYWLKKVLFILNSFSEHHAFIMLFFTFSTNLCLTSPAPLRILQVLLSIRSAEFFWCFYTPSHKILPPLLSVYYFWVRISISSVLPSSMFNVE